MTIASLPMYDLPEVRRATDAWWAGLAAGFTRAGVPDVPSRLDRDREMAEVWHAPDLLISQACGYPLTHALAGVVRPVATPVYGAEGCNGANYRSFFIVRADDPAAGLEDLRRRRVAVNAPHSQSGYNCLRHALAPLSGGRPFFSEVLVSGGHAASLTAVREGRADLAATDCVTFALLARHQPAAVADLRVLAESAPAPALPYVTQAAADPDLLARLRAGLRQALEDPDLAEARDALLLKGAEVLPDEAYRAINEMEDEAIALRYPEVA